MKNAANDSPQRNWVTPNFERQDLKDALAGISTTVSADGTTGYS